MTDEKADDGVQPSTQPDSPTGRLFQRFSRRSAVWVTAAAALIAGGSAIALVASDAPASPKPAALESSAAPAPKNALDAILAKNPDLSQKVPDLISKGTLPKAAYVGDNGLVDGAQGKAAPLPTGPSANSFLAGPVNGAYTLVQLASLALSAGCSPTEAPTAGAIAAAESGGNPGAQGDITLQDATWDWSAGLWQIRGLKSERGTGGLRDSIANADPRKNAQAMTIISTNCTNWTPWSTYNSGAYLAYLPLMGQAVHAATVYFASNGTYPPLAPADTAPVTVPQGGQSPSHKPAPARHGKRPVRKGGTGTRSGSGGGSGTGSGTGGGSSTKPTAPLPAKTSAVPAKTSDAPSVPSLPLPSLPKPSLPTLPKPSVSLPVKLPTPSLTVSLPKVPGVPVPTVSVPGVTIH